VVSVARECSPGAGRTRGLVQIPIYENFNTLQPNFETINLNRAKPGVGPEGFAVGLGTYALTGNVYAFGSGFGNMPAPWTNLIEAAGYARTRYVDGGLTPPTASTAAPSPVQEMTDGWMSLGYYYYIYSKVVSGVEQNLTAIAGTGSTQEAHLTGVENSVKLHFDDTNFLVNDVIRIYRTTVYASTQASPAGPFFFVGQFKKTSTSDTTGSTYSGWAGDGSTFWDVWGDPELAEPSPNNSTSPDLEAPDYLGSGIEAWTAWRPLDQGHPSLTVWTYLDHARYPATGVRGNISFTGDTGKLFQGAIDFQGVYNSRDANSITGANPTLLSGNPGIPPRLCGFDLHIHPEGGSDLTPIVKSVGINLGASTTQRLNGNSDECLIEYGIFNEFDPRFTCQVEVDNVTDYIEYFRTSKRFQFRFTIRPIGGSPGDGSNMTFANYSGSGDTVYRALLAEAPQFADSNGVRTVNLNFVCGDPLGDDGFLAVYQS
jgi:hypothetical protein